MCNWSIMGKNKRESKVFDQYDDEKSEYHPKKRVKQSSQVAFDMEDFFVEVQKDKNRNKREKNMQKKHEKRNSRFDDDYYDDY